MADKDFTCVFGDGPGVVKQSIIIDTADNVIPNNVTDFHTGWATIKFDKNDKRVIHIVPNNDTKEHLVENCPCHPDELIENLFAHHSFDRREEYENGRLKN